MQNITKWLGSLISILTCTCTSYTINKIKTCDLLVR